MDFGEIRVELQRIRRQYLEDRRIEGLDKWDNLSTAQYEPVVELPEAAEVPVESQWTVTFTWYYHTTTMSM